MLTQPAERDKLDAAVRFWAPIYPVLVEWTFQVLVELHERIERPVAQETSFTLFVCSSYTPF